MILDKFRFNKKEILYLIKYAMPLIFISLLISYYWLYLNYKEPLSNAILIKGVFLLAISKGLDTITTNINQNLGGKELNEREKDKIDKYGYRGTFIRDYRDSILIIIFFYLLYLLLPPTFPVYFVLQYTLILAFILAATNNSFWILKKLLEKNIS